ncbi:hypothetical protein MAPG_04764 [Magnaporthiopsis poae ATCC 64411]|uniref:ceramidase n=1 Tax=Magnaporthiopsis poae (strain ATCC 64411 / 73-15) TaxID=644358 RepID=A0A0C4DXL0_MAGP6|nr:hypothetical protein MAPG_04764 [Magnaporthiopsis poae ATCC 64411]
MDSAGLRRRSRETSKQQTGATATAASLEIVEVKSPDSSTDTTASQRPPQQKNHDVDDGRVSCFPPITLRPPTHSRDEDAAQPPRFTIDLSEKPEQRYRHVADRMRDAVAVSDLADLFDSLVRSVTPGPLVSTLHALARHALRRLYCAEETAELRGIAAASGIALHLLVAFNVLLDLLLGCSSGGMRVVCPGSKDGSSSRILHFRTLDWGMEELRALTVELDFVRRPGGPVVATSVTYFGYVGVLTGVRRGLSMSLNFRPHHDRSTWRRRFGFRWHQIMVVLGFRQSVSSVLRALLLTPDPELDGGDAGGADTGAKQQKKWWWMRKKSSGKPGTTHNKPDVSTPIIHYIKNQLPATRSTAAYLIFCTADEGRTLEKDNGHGQFHSSSGFHATYNHDRADEAEPQRLEHAAHGAAEEAAGMETIVGMSMIRARGMERRLGRASSRLKAKAKSKSGSEHGSRRRRKSSIGSADGVHNDDCSREVSPDDVLKLVLNPEICNEETHYAVVMDPGLGKVLWRRAFPLELPPDSGSADDATDGDAPPGRHT